MIVRYFASVREQLGMESEQITEPCSTVHELINLLGKRGSAWDILHSEQTLVAVDQELTDKNAPLTNTSEVAFFPFMTGG